MYDDTIMAKKILSSPVFHFSRNLCPTVIPEFQDLATESGEECSVTEFLNALLMFFGNFRAFNGMRFDFSRFRWYSIHEIPSFLGCGMAQARTCDI